MRNFSAALGVLVLGGCAFPTAVQRVGVEYNGAVAGMANELTLLNILRAQEDLPLHYTSVTTLRGNITVKSGGSLNSALRGDGTTTTGQTVETVSSAAAPTGTTTTSSSAATAIRQVAEGVDVTTPSLSGEITTGPTFDVSVLDTQKFYNGILSAIPFTTVENYTSQGFDNQLLIRLLIERVDIKVLEGLDKGKTVISWINEPGTDAGKIFARRMACYRLEGANLPVQHVDLMPASRLRRSDSSSLMGLTLQEVALLDGKTLDLSEPIGPDPKSDANVMIRRPMGSKRVAALVPMDEVMSSEPPKDTQKRRLWEECAELRTFPVAPPQERVLLRDNKVLALDADGTTAIRAKAELTTVFRSPESVIRYVGRYLRTGQQEPLDGGLVFDVTEGKPSGSLVSAELLGRRYSVRDDENRRRSMQVIAIIQQLVNLHKESADRPSTVPVQIVGG